MKPRLTLFIIALLTIALVGLVIIQGYWVRNAYIVKQANFIRDVNDASQEVIIDLEKMELANQLTQHQNNAERFDYLDQVDSINQILLHEMQSINTRKDLEIFFNKFFIARDLIQDMMILPGHDLSDRQIDPCVLDSLLEAGFDRRSIRTAYEFGVYNPAKKQMIMQKTGRFPHELMDAGLSFHLELFPDNLEANPDYLLLYFPNERRFLIGQIWIMLAVSISLIIIITLSFAYTLFMLYRQRRLTELKTDFINNMTHEFKTPVSTISLACEALNDGDIQKSEDLVQSYINVISEENKRLGQMAEKILQSATLEKGELVLHKELVDIHAILSEVIKNIGIQIEIKDGQIIKDFKAENSLMEVDRVHFTNVAHNLLDNANKYTPVKPQIVVSTRNIKGGLILGIEDNGIGIAKVDQKKIFEKLYRVPEGNIHNFKGFGLGLSYVKTIVEKHGGTIRLESELKKGTKFEIFLPLNN
jgi:two-component system phosphate regulon sensor histidine kinase PhoR